MFVLLVIILSIISFSLRLSASGLELATKVSRRLSKSKNKESDRIGKVLGEVVKVGLTTSVSFMRLSAFIVSRVRDLVGFIGSYVLLIDIIIFLIIVLSTSSYLMLLDEQDVNTNTVIESIVED